MTRAQKVAPLFALVVLVLAVGWCLLPFKFAAGVDCGPPLFGGKPKSDTSVGLILPDIDCPAKARSRLLVSATISVLAVGAAAAAVALKPISSACMAGRHDDCKEWWGNFLSDTFEGLGCQCECHTGRSLY